VVFLSFLSFLKKKGFENRVFEIRAVVKYPPFRTIIYIYIYIRKGKKETPPHPIGDNYTHPFPFFFFYLKLKSFLRNDFREAVVLLKATTFPCAGTRMGTPVVRSGSFPHETGGEEEEEAVPHIGEGNLRSLKRFGLWSG
jgi:hypothetical protein